MKTPKNIKAIAIVDGNNPIIDIFDIYKKDTEDISLNKGEKMCVVKIEFVEYI